MARTLVNMGRVTSRDPSMLEDGELAEAQDCYYAPANPGLKSVLGRQAFNSSPEASALVGGGYLGFDSGTPLIVTLRRGGTTYRKATAGATGTFSDLLGFDGSSYALAGTAETFDQAYYRDKHILVNGVDRPRIVQPDGTQMFLGMLAATAAPTIARDGGAGTGFTLTAGKKIYYWIEERVKVNGIIVKRSGSADATVATLTGDGTLDKPLISRPVLVNPDTTHWALFASGTDVAFPIGAEVGEVTSGQAAIEDTRTGTDPSVPGGAAYSIVSVSILGLVTNRPKYGPPPIGTSVDVYADSVIMNDVSQPGQMAYSVTDDIHAWPDIFRIKLDTKYYDKVVALRAFDNFALALLNNGVWRINTLPKSTDNTFEPDRAKAEIEGAAGIVNAKALAKFSFGEGMRLAYVSPTGQVVVTEGTRWTTISDDMATSELDLTQLNKSRLIANSRDYRLEFGYVENGATRPTKTAFLHYHSSQAKNSETAGLRAKMTWPIQRDINDAFLVKINGVDEVFSCNEDGRVYRHDVGFTEPTGGTITIKVRTREDYPADVGTHSICRELWTHHQAVAGASATVRVISHDSAEPESPVSFPIPLDYREATPCGANSQAEAFQFEFEVVAPPAQVTLDYFAPDYDYAGKTEDK